MGGVDGSVYVMTLSTADSLTVTATKANSIVFGFESAIVGLVEAILCLLDYSCEVFIAAQHHLQLRDF